MSKVIINKYMSLVKNYSNEGELYITGDIEDFEWWEEDVTPTKIRDELDKLGTINQLKLIINSNGGSVEAGNFIFNILNDYKIKNNIPINAYITTAKSMATGIAMAADKVYMYANGIFMIHKPIGQSSGNSNTFRTMAEILDVYEKTLISNYMSKFKGTDDELAELLANETFLTAQQAKDLGFVDEIIEPMKVVAYADGFLVNDVLFKNKEVVNIYNSITERKEITKMKYDKSLLEDYGVSENVFNSFSNIKDFMVIINSKFDEIIENTKKEISDNFEKNKVEPFIDKETICKEIKVEDIEVSEVIDLINKGVNAKEVDPEIENKAKQFEEIKLMKIDDALNFGMKALGPENFENTMWKKVLSGMDYKDICNMEKTWKKQAKEALNAGNKVSEAEKKIINKNIPKLI